MKTLPIALLALLTVGCSQSTEVSAQPTEADLKQAAQKRAASVEDRKDLTPEQKAGLARYHSGGAGVGQSGPPR